MDASLLRERDAFRKKAMAQPAVEKKRPKPGSFSGRPQAKKKKPGSSAMGKLLSTVDLRAMSSFKACSNHDYPYNVCSLGLSQD